MNPVCTVLYAAAAWTFFRERVMFEEAMLVNFFAQEYKDYQKRVPTLLPFIPGYKVNEKISPPIMEALPLS